MSIPLGPDTPLAIPPPGVLPNYVNPESRGFETIIVVTICLSLMLPFFVLRIYSRAFVTHSLGWDDYTCGIGVIGSIAFAGAFVNMLNFGYQTHTWDLTIGKFEPGLKWLLVYTELYGPTIFFIKISILILYLRIFSPNRAMRILVYIGMGYVFLVNTVFTILFAALCAPRNGEAYIIQYTTPVCVNNVDNIAIATSIVNFVSDLYLLALPLPLVWKLHLSSRRKLGLIAVFMTGTLACVSSMVSIIVRSLWGHDPDYAWWSPRLVFTTLIEMNIGIICACMPACAAIFRQPFTLPSSLKSLFSKSTSRGSVKQSNARERSNPNESDFIKLSERPGVWPSQDGYRQSESSAAMESATKPTVTRVWV